MEYLELYEKVEKWAKDRYLNFVDPITQSEKLFKTTKEIVDYNINASPKIKDSLGFYQVELIVYCLILDAPLKEYIEQEGRFWVKNAGYRELIFRNYDPIKSLTLLDYSSPKIGVYIDKPIEECYDEVYSAMQFLHDIAKKYNTTLEETLELAYNKIKDKE